MKTEIKNIHRDNGVDFNFIIINEHFRSGDDILFFENDEKIIFIEQDDQLIDMFDLLVFAEIFRSKGDAKRNWKKSSRDIPKGFSEFKNIGKLNRKITIFNPIGTN